mgnify:CR=1 FL=1
MNIPNGFRPSGAARATFYDEEGRLREFNISRGMDEGGVSSTNSMFATEAEDFGSIAPFLHRAKVKDAKRRNYVIQPGGAAIYFDDERAPELPSRQEFPHPKTSFGHDSLDSTAMAQGGVSFTVGIPGARS